MLRPVSRSLALSVVVCAVAAAAVWAQVVRNGPLPQPLPLFPADNWWNLDISNAPVDPNSAGYIASIGNHVGVHPDFGGDAETEPEIYGIPFISVPGTQPLVPVTWTAYGSQSDDSSPCGPPGYPIPEEAKTQSKWIEGGYAGNADPDTTDGDRHMLIVDRDNGILYELFRTFWNAVAGEWEAASGAIFPLDHNDRRPDTWTSADASGMAVMPGLVRYDEAYEGTEPIRHAFRFTTFPIHGYVYPASHDASTTSNTNYLPLGARLRLKANTVVSNPENDAGVARIVQAMKTHGLILTDNGSDLYVTGTYDTRWDNGILNPALDSLEAEDFEVIQLGWHPAPQPVPRDQFAVYMLRALETPCYQPPDCGTPSFPNDVPCAHEYADWIEDLQGRGVIEACAAGSYCPKAPVTRAQLAAFFVRAKGMLPLDCTSQAFADVPCAHPYADWITRAVDEGYLSSCDTGRFCPDDAVTRIQLDQLLADSF